MKSIPLKPREAWVIKKAREFICKANISWLPVDPFKIAKDNGWEVVTVGSIASKARVPRNKVINGYDSDVYYYKGKYKIVYNENAYRIRTRYSIAHEIGHIVLNHLIDFEQTRVPRGGLTSKEYRILEREAELFAAELLMPLPIIKELNINDYKNIMRICSVSKATADIRCDELLKKKINRNNPDVKLLIEQFNLFLMPTAVCPNMKTDKHLMLGIHKKGVLFVVADPKLYVETNENGRFTICPRCGNQKFSKNANFCRMCGLYLYNECGEIPSFSHSEDDSYVSYKNQGDARFCEHCGNETMLSRLGLLLSWEEVIKSHKNIDAAYQPEEAKKIEFNESDVPF